MDGVGTSEQAPLIDPEPGPLTSGTPKPDHATPGTPTSGTPTPSPPTSGPPTSDTPTPSPPTSGTPTPDPPTSDVAHRWLPWLAVLTVVTVFSLVVFGSRVRVSGSGMGCPDWPLCDGRIGPIMQFHALMEQLHRYLAATVTVLVVATAVVAVRDRSRPATARPAVVAVAIIVVQIALGALTVFAGNGPPTVALHLLTGLTLLACTTVTATCALVPRRAGPGPRLGRLGWAAVAAAALLLVSGSLIVNAGAEASCGSFPLCPVGQPTDLAAFHLAHRSMAALAVMAIALFTVHAWTYWSQAASARVLAAAVVVLVTATASLGVLSALHLAPPTLQDLHLAGAAAVLVGVVALATTGWLTGADSSAADRATAGRSSERV